MIYLYKKSTAKEIVHYFKIFKIYINYLFLTANKLTYCVYQLDNNFTY